MHPVHSIRQGHVPNWGPVSIACYWLLRVLDTCCLCCCRWYSSSLAARAWARARSSCSWGLIIHTHTIILNNRSILTQDIERARRISSATWEETACVGLFQSATSLMHAGEPDLLSTSQKRQMRFIIYVHSQFAGISEVVDIKYLTSEWMNIPTSPAW